MCIKEKLYNAGVKFEAIPVFSNFYGTQYNFATLKDARKAEKATGISFHGKRGKYHFTLY